MFFPSERQIEIFEGLNSQLTHLTNEWLEKLDGETPLTPDAVRRINQLISTTHKLVSRMPDAMHVQPLPAGRVMPADAGVSLLMAHGALKAFFELYTRKTHTGGWQWNEPENGRCPLCLSPMDAKTPGDTSD
jgi:hypothetical protein